MIFLTRRDFEEEVNKRIEMVMHNREQEDRYWRLMERIEKLEAEFNAMKALDKVVINTDKLPFADSKIDLTFMEHG